MNTFLTAVATTAVFDLIQIVCGLETALWLASVVMAFCLGVFWSTGRAIREGK
jgi:hypothetical protein